VAYFTELQYGNEGMTKGAQAVHNLTYVAVFAALGGFIGAIWFAKKAVVTALT
jgi:hypothetical protein